MWKVSQLSRTDLIREDAQRVLIRASRRSTAKSIRHAADTPEVESSLRRRKRSRHLRVPVLPEEAEVIEAQARAVGMSIAAYLRAVGSGYQPRAIVDRDRLEQMLRVNGDLGRLGGLLKMWLWTKLPSSCWPS